MKKLLFIFLLCCSLKLEAQLCYANFEGYPFINTQPPQPPNTVFFSNLSTNGLTWLWDFGDYTTSTLQTPAHTYSAPGLYYVCLTITDSNTCSDTFCDSIWVSTCQTDFGYVSTLQPNTIKFFDMPANNPNFPTNWLWDFGDFSTSNLRLPTHTYSSPGTYLVCFNANDSAVSCICGQCKYVTVSPPQNVKISVCDGNWTDPNTWNTASVPTANDSILIFNNVVFNTNHTVNSPAILYIEENSSLCGHFTLSSRIMMYGALHVDTMYIPVGYSYTDFIPLNALSISITGPWLTQYSPSISPFSCNVLSPCSVGIQETIDNLEMSVYPNPTSGSVTINYKFSQGEAKGEIIIYDIAGVEVKRVTVTDGNSKIELDNSSLQSGIYICQLTTNKGTTATKKMVVVK